MSKKQTSHVQWESQDDIYVPITRSLYSEEKQCNMHAENIYTSIEITL